MSKLPFTVNRNAEITPYLTGPKPKVVEVKAPSKLRTIICYGVVFVGVAVASFYATDAFSQGSMAPEVRVIEARPSPSIIRLGNQGSDAKAREFRAREELKQSHRIELEELRHRHRRQLEADRAYYKRLGKKK